MAAFCLSTFLPVFQPSPASKFIQGYLGAVISAVSIAVSNSYPAPGQASLWGMGLQGDAQMVF